MIRPLEKLGWTKLKEDEYDKSLVQRDGYVEIFVCNRNHLELSLFADGGITICMGRWTNMEPDEVQAMFETLEELKNEKH